MKDLCNKVILITGGSKGVGAAIAKMASAQGASVIITARNKAPLEAVANTINNSGGRALAISHDVSKLDQWQQVLNRIEKEFGALHGLVNNAGVHSMKPLLEYTEDDYNWMMDINLKGVMFGIQSCLPLLAQSGTTEDKSAIVNMSSIAGLQSTSMQSLYAMSKGGLELYTRAIAQETKEQRLAVRVNNVNPGIIETDMGHELVQQVIDFGFVEDEKGAKKFLSKEYMDRRFATAQEVAAATCFLLSNQSAFTTGTSLPVDGGFLA